MVLEDDEGWRITRAQLALRLHVSPLEIDRLSIRDVMDLRAVIAEENEAINGGKSRKPVW